VLALLDAGHTVTIVDNLSNSFLRVLEHVKRIAGPEKAAKITFAQVRFRLSGRCFVSIKRRREIFNTHFPLCLTVSLAAATAQTQKNPKQIDLRDREALDKVFAEKK